MNKDFKTRFDYSCDSKSSYKQQVEKLLNKELNKHNLSHFE